jgi:DNA adenine methylase
VDPPYLHSTRGRARGYRFEMTDAEHECLADCLHTLRGAVVLSGYPSPLYARLYADWRRVERVAFADNAEERLEVLWLSPNCPEQGLFKSA